MRLFIALIALLALAGCAIADDIVTMPTANQLKAGEVDAAIYYLGLNLPAGAPQQVNYQTLYVGITNRLELDVHHADVDKDETSTVLVGSLKLFSETKTMPDVVVGCRNITGEATTRNPFLRAKSEDRSYFISTAKTFFMNPKAPGPPLVRLHLSLGTPDWTLLGDKRHDGVFGGLQFLFHPEFGAVTEYDGESWITGLTIMPKNSGLTFKGGTYGKHWWVGLAFRKQLKF
jgi:hypothetical protein